MAYVAAKRWPSLIAVSAHVIAEDGHPAVVSPPVDEQQVAQELKLADGKVGVIDGLHALFTRDADADVPRLRPRDVSALSVSAPSGVRLPLHSPKPTPPAAERAEEGGAGARLHSRLDHGNVVGQTPQTAIAYM